VMALSPNLWRKLKHLKRDRSSDDMVPTRIGLMLGRETARTAGR
jgi:hypothetical protein